MKRIVAVVILAVLACVLFLVPYASAEVEITCSVYPEEADFKSDFVYSITIRNPDFIATGELSLIVGSDSDNRGISGEWNVLEMELEPGSSCVIENWKIRIPKGGSCTVKKGVDFTHPELNQGAFRDWTENPKSPEWNKTWYECCFTPKPEDLGDEVCCEGSGAPILTHCIEKFKEHHVEQNETYENLSFDYYITVWANCKDRIELQVRNYSNTSSSGWDKHVQKNYTVLDVYTNKTLTWHAVNLTIDNFDTEGRGQYKFVGYTNKSQTYSDPRIEERFKDPKVSYKKTINELLSFDYEVSAWVDLVKDNIKLEVYNYSLNDWEPKGIRNYTKPGYNQTLRWVGINLSCDYFDGNPLSGKYRFVGTYKTSSNITGPVIEEKFYPLDVAPTQGTNKDTFNYSVKVNANISDKIMLQVKNHTTNLWDSKGTRDYTTPDINETLTWQNIKLNTHELNRHKDSIFRFVGMCGVKSSEEGLRLPIWPIKPVFRNLSVKPDRELYSDNFFYGVDVKAEKNGTVKLSIFCPDGSLLRETEQDYNKAPGGRQTLNNWPPVQFNGCDVKTGDAGYRFGFWYERSEIINRTKEGPYIWIANFENGTVEPELGTDETLFNYTINVSAAHEGTVELLIKCPEGSQWVTKGEKGYETSKTTKTLKWTRIELPCDNCGNAEYKFRFEPGFVESENYTGPEIIEEKISDFSVFPNKGSDTSKFNFSATVSSTKVGTIPLLLQVSPDRAAWLNVTTSTYDNVRPGERIPIYFTVRIEDANLTQDQKDELLLKWNTTGVIYWRITGFFSQSDIITTNWAIDQEWHKWSCTPKEGWWNETYYNFNVTVSAGVSGVVELWLKTNTSYLLGTKEYRKKGSPEDYNWRVNLSEVIEAEYEGGTEYEFLFRWGDAENKSGWIKGPQLYKRLVINITDYTVYPASKYNYIFSDGDVLNHFTLDESSQIEEFLNYRVNVSANKDTDITLVTIDPSGKEAELETKQYTGPERKELNWSVKLEDIEQSPGTWNYTFDYSYYDPDMHKEVTERCSEKKGPAINAILHNFAIVPEYIVEYGAIQYGDTFNVSCDVTGTKGTKAFNVTLIFFCNGKRYELGTFSYGGEGEEELNWTDINIWNYVEHCTGFLLGMEIKENKEARAK